MYAAGSGYSQLKVSGLALLNGSLDVITGQASRWPWEIFSLILFGSESGDFTSFYLNNVACSSSSSDLWTCGRYQFREQFTNGALDLAASTPLPSTWTMMLIGLGGLGFAGYRQSKKSALPATVWRGGLVLLLSAALRAHRAFGPLVRAMRRRNGAKASYRRYSDGSHQNFPHCRVSCFPSNANSLAALVFKLCFDDFVQLFGVELGP